MKRIIVCTKPVPDPKHWGQVSMDSATKTLKREGIPTIMNPLDRHALEAAIVIREALGGEVVLLSMAPSFTKALLREGLAMGADRAVLLSDPLFAGSDTLATARILAAGCRWIGDFDLVICGNSSLDGSTGQVSPQLAEFLALPNVMHVVDLGWEGKGQLILTQRIEHGHTKLRACLPLVIAVRKEVNKPRYISFRGILAAEAKQITELSNDDLKVDRALIGLNGSPTRIVGLEIRRFERAKERIEGSIEEIVQQLADRIHLYGII